MKKFDELYVRLLPVIRVLLMFIFVLGVWTQDVERTAAAGFLLTWLKLDER